MENEAAAPPTEDSALPPPPPVSVAFTLHPPAGAEKYWLGADVMLSAVPSGSIETGGVTEGVSELEGVCVDDGVKEGVGVIERVPVTDGVDVFVADDDEV